MRRAVRLAIDVGKARVGVARTDVDGTMALPIETIKRDADATSRIVSLINEYEVAIVYVGYPLNLRGEQTASTLDAVEFAHEIATQTNIPIYLVDERLSTVSATASLQSAGHNVKSAKAIVDQAAAVVILEQALEIERNTNTWAGRELSE